MGGADVGGVRSRGAGFSGPNRRREMTASVIRPQELRRLPPSLLPRLGRVMSVSSGQEVHGCTPEGR